jgi:hypothetical protein
MAGRDAPDAASAAPFSLRRFYNVEEHVFDPR